MSVRLQTRCSFSFYIFFYTQLTNPCFSSSGRFLYYLRPYWHLLFCSSLKGSLYRSRADECLGIFIYMKKKLWKKLIKKEFYKIVDVNFIKIYIFHKISLLLKIIWIFKRLLSSITCNYLVHFATSAPKSFPGRPALKKFLLFSKKKYF